jgi:peptide/nickel transport system substrate-binding protein
LLVAQRTGEGVVAGEPGSGPFRVSAWEPGKRAVLAANENCPEGRPFVDSIEIQMGRSAADRLLDLELDRADLVEVAPQDARRASERGLLLSVSQPDELVALAFIASRPAAENARIREAVSRSIDRAAIVNFILQKEGEPAGGLLPQWSSGTAFLFSTAVDLAETRAIWSQIGGAPKIALGYDSGDPLEQMIAERIAVNAREAGGSVAVVPVKPGAAPNNIDARFVQLRMPSSHPRATLAAFVGQLNAVAGIAADPPPQRASPQQIYDSERAIVSSYRIVPLVWLPRVYGVGPRVRDWKTPASGEAWPLADVWLGDKQ